MIIAKEEYKNMMVIVTAENNIYTVKAIKNGASVGCLTTADKSEAQAVYSETVFAMYK